MSWPSAIESSEMRKRSGCRWVGLEESRWNLVDYMHRSRKRHWFSRTRGRSWVKVLRSGSRTRRCRAVALSAYSKEMAVL